MGALNWQQYDKRKEELYKEQEENISKLRELIGKFLGTIRGEWKDSDGWDSFQVYYFAVEDSRGDIRKYKGSDDNTCVSHNGATIFLEDKEYMARWVQRKMSDLEYVKYKEAKYNIKRKIKGEL